MNDSTIKFCPACEKEWQNNMGDKAVPVANGGASTTASGTLTRKQIEDFRTDGIIRPSDNSGELPAWAIEENLILNTLCDYYLQEAAIRSESALAKNKVDRTAPETSTRSADE